MPKDNKVQLSFAMLDCTGCRPVEVKQYLEVLQYCRTLYPNNEATFNALEDINQEYLQKFEQLQNEIREKYLKSLSLQAGVTLTQESVDEDEEESWYVKRYYLRKEKGENVSDYLDLLYD